MIRRILLVALLSGCASHSGVVPMGQGAYLITKQASTGFPGLGDLKAEVLREADQHCTKTGKELKVEQVNETKPPYVFGNYPRVELQFRCT